MVDKVENTDDKLQEFPLELVIDMAITMKHLADKFNCNDGQLEQCGLDWAYFHKLNRRVQYQIEKFGNLK